MYCYHCKISFEEELTECPVCGRRLSESEFYAGAISDEIVYSDQRQFSNAGNGKKFNFSKPLCFVFALLLIGSMLLPFIIAKVSINGEAAIDNKTVGILSIRSDADAAAEKIVSAEGAVFTGEESAKLKSDAGKVSVGAIAGFAFCAANLLLFGAVGLFSKGKLRYFFGRIGADAYIVLLLLLIAFAFFGKSVFGGIAEKLKAHGVDLGFTAAPTAWLFAALAAAILVRTLGFRAIRYMNGTACMNSGDYRTAEREFTRIRCYDKVPHTFGKSRHRRGVHYGSGDSSKDYGDGVV